MSPSKPNRTVTANEILVATLTMAEGLGWSRVRLHTIAEELGISLKTLYEIFSDQNAVADAWFHTGLHAMLEPTDKAFSDLPPKDRLHLITMRWFDALAEHREVTVEMLRAKLHPPHAHHWGPLVFSLSHLVQWIREAALLSAEGRRRQLEEIGLTSLLLATIAVWARDNTENQERTRRFLRCGLAGADCFLSRT